MRGTTNVTPLAETMSHAAAHYADGSDPIDLAKLGAIPASDKGKAGGVATLGTDGKVPSGQLPAIDVSSQFQSHNTDKTAHNDIRTLVSNAQTAANTALEAVKKAGGGKSDFQKLIMGGM